MASGASCSYCSGWGEDEQKDCPYCHCTENYEDRFGYCRNCKKPYDDDVWRDPHFHESPFTDDREGKLFVWWYVVSDGKITNDIHDFKWGTCVGVVEARTHTEACEEARKRGLI